MQILKQSLILIIFLSLACLNLALANAASCLKVTGAYGALNPHFVHNNNYTHELEEKSVVRDQCVLGTCSYQTWISNLEATYHYLNYETIPLSEEYLAAAVWRDTAIETLRATHDKVDVDIFGGVLSARNKILRYGLMPKEAWKGSTDFHKRPIATRVAGYLKNVIGRAKWEMEREINSDKKHQILLDAEKQIHHIFDNVTGPLPQEFQFRRQRYYPQNFALDYFPDLTRNLVDMRVLSDSKKPRKVKEDSRNLIVETSDPEDLEKAIIHVVKRGHAVYLSYDHIDEYVDSKTGVMSLAVALSPLSAGPLTREQRRFFEIGKHSNHATLVVGVDVNPVTQKLVKLKLKGNWGTKWGDQGYHHMYRDYFIEFVKGASFYKDLGAPIPKNEAPSEPWQPSLF